MNILKETKLIVVRIIGGLGNQMFQYAYALALKKNGYDVKIDVSIFETYKLHGGYQLENYNISLPNATKIDIDNLVNVSTFEKILKLLFRIKNKRILKEKQLSYKKELTNPSSHSYIIGYFQCEKYFKDIGNDILKEFTINKKLSSYSKEIKLKIENSLNPISLHVRRGDYISNKKANKVHGTCDIDYYKNSINYFKEKFDNLNFFIFSDDIEWVKNNLNVENAVYIEGKEDRIPHEDILLMSLCTHNIIANSSFSWWGAWLNKYDNKIVVAPKRWFQDIKKEEESKTIVPASWIRI